MNDSTNAIRHPTLDELEAGLDHIRQSPADDGPLMMIVSRPAVDEREVSAEGRLDVEVGLVGDSWKDRGSSRTPDGGPNPAAQVTIMNSRTLGLIAQSEERWRLSGASHLAAPSGSRLKSPIGKFGGVKHHPTSDLRRSLFGEVGSGRKSVDCAWRSSRSQRYAAFSFGCTPPAIGLCRR